jgi:competence protein ComEC
MAAFSAAAMLLATAGLLVICLLRSPLRFIGAIFVLMGCVAAMRSARPDVMMSAGGDVVAVRGANGRLAAVKFGNDTLSVREWLAADGDARDPADGTVAAGFACDPDGCVARLPDGAVVAVSRTAAAFADDCIRAALIVTLRAVPADCAATVIDRATLRKSGSMALTWRNGRFEIAASRPEGVDRPWTRRREDAADRNAAQDAAPSATPTSRMPAARRDATPLQPDADMEP